MPRRKSGRRTVTTTRPHCDACSQQIIFIRMTDTGKRLPCDPYPVADGNVCATASGGGLAGYVIAAGRPPQAGWKRYAAHFGSCSARRRPGRARPEKATPAEQLALDLGGDPS